VVSVLNGALSCWGMVTVSMPRAKVIVSERLVPDIHYAGLRPQSNDNVTISTPASAIKYLISSRPRPISLASKSMRAIEHLLVFDKAHQNVAQATFQDTLPDHGVNAK
jgi:hypothetical protein